IAGLLHDLGISRLTPSEQELFLRPAKELSAKDRTKYEQHPETAANLLRNNPYVNPHILDLIQNHEESLASDGPLKKAGPALTQAQQILSLCNCYDKKVTVYSM